MFKGKLNGRIGLSVVVSVAVMSVAGVAGVSPASAAGPWWQLGSSNWPAMLPPQGEGTIVVVADDIGDRSAAGSEVVLKDRLPAGIAAQGVSFYLYTLGQGKFDVGAAFCETATAEVTCRFPAQELSIEPYESLEMRIPVKTEEPVAGVENHASVSGGGASTVSLDKPLKVGSSPSQFGVEAYEMKPEVEGGSVDTQAGSHPFQLTTTLALNQTADPAQPPALAKDLRIDLPAGLIGNPTPFPQCSQTDFAAQGPQWIDFCPNNTAVGVAVITFNEPYALGLVSVAAPLFNLKPSAGEPARFGFSLLRTLNVLDTSVRTGGGYNVVVEDKNITELPNFIAARVTFWGVPGDPAHDSSRGWSCIDNQLYQESGVVPPCTPLGEQKPPPLLTLPTSCEGSLHTTVEAKSWVDRESFMAPIEAAGGPALDGCNRLPFSASIGVVPDGQAASTPSGLTVGVHVPQEEALNSTGLAPAEVKDTTVALPAGVALNPAAADGLEACSEAEIALNADVPVTCPEASKVGTLEIKSPLLPNPLVGAAYLAAQNANPFGSLVALYLVAEDPVSGVLVKVAGEVKPDPVTGQLVSTFKDTPQLPFEDLRLHFFGGDRAPLSTPALCGSYTTTGSIAPWSGNPPAELSSTFDITSGPGGGLCVDPLPFGPSLTAGSTNIQTGAFSPFTMTMSREDGDQGLKAVRLGMPPGLLGSLSGVELCGEADADAGTCGPGSLIGETIVSVGLGGDPFSVRGGKVYITGPYRGAPYGLSIVNPAKAGPYDLGRVVVRARIEVDPLTAALTVTTDSSGPFAIPQILDGIPLQIKHVNVSIDRPGFTFNPTNCAPMSITGVLTSSQGATDSLSVPFQVTNCATLAFKPKFKVATTGKTSRQKGASLNVKLAYPKARWGSQANIKSVKVDLPKQLPSRLSTLQKACTASVFDANPAACPAASRVGTARATTPIIPEALSGPAYFVSYGGAKFPELVIVLSGTA